MASDRNSRGYGDGYQALLRATVSVVAQRGLRGTTYRAVAEEAGVKNTLITYHFGSRDALLVETVRWTVEESVRQTPPRDLWGPGMPFVRSLVDMVRRDPELQSFHYEILIEARRNPQMRELGVLLVNSFLEAIEAALSERGYPEPRLLARVVHAVIDGLVFQQLTMEDPETTERALALFVEMLEQNAPGTGVAETAAP
ncbi:TetR/AcrR family transcriptional regulator [Microbacterium sp. 18062]|uniref:TetR/AcrR family transcriptional regulator n=1 Tax=Microbacterium sp. 18062 TaxID=2681410 RepID=UPI00135C0AFE|nr:TetR family transcriptional regulator [Microbacterium sp. 18062]